MPSTTETGSKAAPKRQTAKKPTTAKPKQEAAPAAATPTPTPAPAPIDDSLFDDATPTPPAAEQKPIEPAAPSEPSDTPTEAQEGAKDEGAAEEQTALTDPAPASPSAPEPAAPPPPPAPEPQAPAGQQQVDQAKDKDLVEQPAPSASPTRVRLGRIEGALHRVPLEVVQMLAAESRSRIETLLSSPSIADLQKRMRVSEGRCAPIFFTMGEDDERPFLFAGVEAIAAAINLGLTTVSVVTIAVGDAGAAQQHLATWANGRPASTQEDVLEVIE